MYDIRLLSIENTVDDESFNPHRIIFSRDHPNQQLMKLLTERFPTSEVLQVKPSTYKGILRNVPNMTKTVDFVTVGFQPCTTDTTYRGPILVLIGLEYKGNVGTIVRTAVQSNLYEQICIVDAEPGPKTTHDDSTDSTGEQKFWEKNKRTSISDEDVIYYSLCNAPLINIQRFANEKDFLQYATTKNRCMVGVDGGTTVYGKPVDLLHPSSWEVMKRKDLFLVFGSETNGLSQTFLDACDHLGMLPCLSASINVASCFSAVDTIIKIARNAPPNDVKK